MGVLIGFDLDGTLLTDDKAILDEDASKIRHWQERGHLVAIATGRKYGSARGFLEKANLSLPIIANNGSSIWDEEGRPLYAQGFYEHELSEILEFCQEKKIGLVAHIAQRRGVDILTSEKTLPVAKGYLSDTMESLGIVEEFQALTEEIVFALVAFCSEDTQEKLVAWCKETRICNLHILSSRYGRQELIELLPRGVHKADGMLRLCRAKGYEGKTICVGDDFNDGTMLSQATQGILMKNHAPGFSPEDVMVTKKSNNESGAVKAVQEVLRKWGYDED